MTAAVPVASSATATTGSRPGTAAEPRDGATAAAGFDSQLHAARQQHGAARANDAPAAPQDERQPASAARSPRDPVADAAPAAKPDAAPATPVATAVPVEPAEVAAPNAPAEPRESDEPAAAVAGAMLALLGSSLAGVWPPAAAGVGVAAGAPAPGGKGVAGDARAAAMLQLAAASPAATPVDAVPLAASMLLPAQATRSAADALDKQSAEAHAPVAVLSAPATSAAPPTAHRLQLPVPPGSPSFAQDLGQQVAWLSGQNVKQARIRLHPEELGSLDVSVSVNHGRVDVVFSAQHAAAVPAVQQSLPQLDQMLARHGLSLGHAEVGQRDRGDRRGQGAHAGAAVEEIADVHGAASVTLARIGLLDAFA